MDKKCPKKLDLNAPFLSTKRANLKIPRANSLSACNRVPFSWEQSPGKPKDTENTSDGIGEVLPRPKPPPGRQAPPSELIKFHNGGQHDHDEGCDGDIEDEYDSFSDAIDMFSLSEAIDFVEPVNYFDESSGTQSPSFIIQRFLQDAKALAVASSALTVPKDTKYTEKCGVYSTPKGCGLEILLPWRVKHKPCAVKSPVREPPLKLKPRWGVREKQNGSLEESSWRRGGVDD
ncbi:hypothetical protein LguiA_016422 [Lonicera macranthoides]